MKPYQFVLTTVLAIFLIFSFLGCNNGSGGGGGDDETCPEPTLDISVCDPADKVIAEYFSTTIDNEFFPLTLDTEIVLEGEDDGETVRVEITVPGDTEVVAGVETLVMVETEYEDGELLEISRNFIVQAEDGTVCYFGEDVDIYDNGVVVSNDGAWRAGENGNLPGILMPGTPQVGDTFFQESAPGIAEDMSTIVAFGETIDVPAGVFDDTLTAEDCNPMEDAETDEKVYVRGIGLAVDDVAELISF
jgi:hypothetical protein